MSVQLIVTEDVAIRAVSRIDTDGVVRAVLCLWRDRFNVVLARFPLVRVHAIACCLADIYARQNVTRANASHAIVCVVSHVHLTDARYITCLVMWTRDAAVMRVIARCCVVSISVFALVTLAHVKKTKKLSALRMLDADKRVE